MILSFIQAVFFVLYGLDASLVVLIYGFDVLFDALAFGSVVAVAIWGARAVAAHVLNRSDSFLCVCDGNRVGVRVFQNWRTAEFSVVDRQVGIRMEQIFFRVAFPFVEDALGIGTCVDTVSVEQPLFNFFHFFF